MAESAETIQKKIAALREVMRGTFDRSKLTLLREELMAEIAKLKKMNGEPEEDRSPPPPQRHR